MSVPYLDAAPTTGRGNFLSALRQHLPRPTWFSARVRVDVRFNERGHKRPRVGLAASVQHRFRVQHQTLRFLSLCRPGTI